MRYIECRGDPSADDRELIRRARTENSFILTRDLFRDHRRRMSSVDSAWLASRLIGFSADNHLGTDDWKLTLERSDECKYGFGAKSRFRLSHPTPLPCWISGFLSTFPARGEVDFARDVRREVRNRLPGIFVEHPDPTRIF